MQQIRFGAKIADILKQDQNASNDFLDVQGGASGNNSFLNQQQPKLSARSNKSNFQSTSTIMEENISNLEIQKSRIAQYEKQKTRQSLTNQMQNAEDQPPLLSTDR